MIFIPNDLAISTLNRNFTRQYDRNQTIINVERLERNVVNRVPPNYNQNS